MSSLRANSFTLLRQDLHLPPLRLFEGVVTPLRDREPSSLDMVCLRENSEGEYSGVGGRVHSHKPEEVAIQSIVFKFPFRVRSPYFEVLPL